MLATTKMDYEIRSGHRITRHIGTSSRTPRLPQIPRSLPFPPHSASSTTTSGDFFHASSLNPMSFPMLFQAGAPRSYEVTSDDFALMRSVARVARLVAPQVISPLKCPATAEVWAFVLPIPLRVDQDEIWGFGRVSGRAGGELGDTSRINVRDGAPSDRVGRRGDTVLHIAGWEPAMVVAAGVRVGIGRGGHGGRETERVGRTGNVRVRVRIRVGKGSVLVVHGVGGFRAGQGGVIGVTSPAFVASVRKSVSWISSRSDERSIFGSLVNISYLIAHYADCYKHISLRRVPSFQSVYNAFQ